MKKVSVSICAGSNCNKNQASWLKQFDQILSPKLRSEVQLICGNCEKCCTSDFAHAPRVKVNGHVFSRATPAQVKQAVLTAA
ncbi:MAG TPA: hypothetical protein VIR63_01015 [Pontiella sp.]